VGAAVATAAAMVCLFESAGDGHYRTPFRLSGRIADSYIMLTLRGNACKAKMEKNGKGDGEFWEALGSFLNPA
jgi:hypothetical protein